MGSNAAPAPGKATDNALNRTRELLGPAYTRQAGLHPAVHNMARDTRRVMAGCMLVFAVGIGMASEAGIVMMLMAISALLVRAWFVGHVVREVAPERILASGELADWAARVRRIDHPPSTEFVETALSALRHPRTSVIDLARQCANIAAFEAASARRLGRMQSQ